jgi:hypothetical protein
LAETLAENLHRGDKAASLHVEANARRAYVLAQAPADETLAVAKAQAERDYRLVELNAYELLVQAHAALDRAYWITETAALAAVGATFASSNGTPWAYYGQACVLCGAAELRWTHVFQAKETGSNRNWPMSAG